MSNQKRLFSLGAVRSICSLSNKAGSIFGHARPDLTWGPITLGHYLEDKSTIVQRILLYCGKLKKFAIIVAVNENMGVDILEAFSCNSILYLKLFDLGKWYNLGTTGPDLAKILFVLTKHTKISLHPKFQPNRPSGSQDVSFYQFEQFTGSIYRNASKISAHSPTSSFME